MDRFGFRDVLEHILAGDDMEDQGLLDLFGAIFDGKCTSAQIAAVLVAFRARGESTQALVALASSLRKRQKPFDVTDISADCPLVDTCGTGGDHAISMNVSTLASWVAAGAGVRIAKHGNRAVSSHTGSADLIESFSCPLDGPSPHFEDKLRNSLKQSGFCFLFAPRFHQAMKHVATPRKELSIRTIFNLLGPLVNPARTSHQVIGVFQDSKRKLMAEAFLALGGTKAWVLHAPRAQGGLDEISPEGMTLITEANADGTTHDFVIHPSDFGVEPVSLSSIHSGGLSETRERTIRMLRGESDVAASAILLNAAAVILVSGLTSDRKEAYLRAKESLMSGKALECFHRWLQCMNEGNS